MLQRAPGRLHDDDATSWCSTVVMFAALLALETVFVLLWIHYVGPLPVEP